MIHPLGAGSTGAGTSDDGGEINAAPVCKAHEEARCHTRCSSSVKMIPPPPPPFPDGYVFNTAAQSNSGLFILGKVEKTLRSSSMFFALLRSTRH